jgi:hypothetical protein
MRYDPDRRLLKLGFTTGRIYAYEGVPSETHRELRAAPSRGAYFNQFIRDRYPCERIDEQAAAGHAEGGLEDGQAK